MQHGEIVGKKQVQADNGTLTVIFLVHALSVLVS
jgi:hypothetical protein